LEGEAAPRLQAEADGAGERSCGASMVGPVGALAVGTGGLCPYLFDWRGSWAGAPGAAGVVRAACEPKIGLCINALIWFKFIYYYYYRNLI
jgi:hypothetical protein